MTANKTKAATAKLIGIGEPDLARILRGAFRGTPVERLMFMLTKLDCSVDIVVKEGKKRAFEPIRVREFR